MALAGVIAGVGQADFGRTGLACLNEVLPLGWWSVYRVFERAPPRLYVNQSLGVPDGTAQSWTAYRDRLYVRDRTFDGVRGLAPRSGCAITQWHADELPPAHRDSIYARHGIRERVSLALDEGAAGVLALNLYRHESQRAFADRDLALLADIGLPLMAAVRVHVRLAAGAIDDDAEPPHPLAVLPRRERQVCDRLLLGWTHDGVAADLAISATTVRTYRDRAFERLGIRHRNELFALALAWAGQAERG